MTYQVKERDEWTWIVVDENGNQLTGKFFYVKQQADWLAEDANNGKLPLTSEQAFALVNNLYDENDNIKQVETPEPVAQPEMPEEIIINEQNEVGSIIEYKGSQWFVAASDYYSAQDQQEDEAGGMGSLSIGWHSWLVKVQPGNQALPVLVELLRDGKAALNSSQTVMFPDKQYSSFLRDLEYSSELGLYDRSEINA